MNIPNQGPVDEGKVEIDNVYYILNRDTHCATVTNRNSFVKSYSGNVTIPQTIEYDGESYTVTRIGYEAMSRCTIDRLELPKTIEVIETGGLSGLIHWVNLSDITSLKVIEGWGITSDMPDISLPKNLEEVGELSCAFLNVHFLNIPASVKYIGPYAFNDCMNLENVQFNCSDKEAIESMGGYCMMTATHLRNMYVPVGTKHLYESLPYFGKYYHIKEGTYQDIPGIDRSILIDDINYIFIPETKTAKVTRSTDRSYPIYDYKEFSNIKIPASLYYEDEEYTVKEVEWRALEGYWIDTLSLPKTIEKIGEYGLNSVHAYEMNMEELSNLTVIDDYGCNGAFGWRGMGGGQKLLLPSNLQTIGDRAFECNILQIVDLPRSLKHIGARAFWYSNKLEAVQTHWTTAEEIQEVCSLDAFEGCDNLKGIIVPTGCKDLYKAIEPWSKYPIFDKYLSLDTLYISLHVGEQIKLHATCSDPSVDCQKLIWETSNDCVQIDQDGNIKALYCGACTDVTVRSEDETIFPAICRIYVLPAIIEEINLEPTFLVGKEREEYDIYPKVTPSYASAALYWSSSDESVATVDWSGHVVLHSEGNCIITASSIFYPDVSATCQVTVCAPEILVSSISLNPSSVDGTEGEQIQINASVLPEDATNKVLNWSSSDESVATVDESGLISLIKKGTAIITAAATDQSEVSENSAISATCHVTVREPEILVSSISLDPSSVDGTEGEQIQISATILPEDATNKVLTWSSSDESVATVDESGLISLIKKGTAVITAAATDQSEVSENSAISATCHVTVREPEILVSSISLDPSSVDGTEGEQIQINASVLPEDATNKVLNWSSSDESVATVDESGLISLIKKGTAVITAAATDQSEVSENGAISATCHVTVREPEILVSSISLDPSSVDGTEGEQIQINASVLPEDATNKVLNWSSSDESVATVDESGLISLIKKGTAIITAAATDESGVSASIDIFVIEGTGIANMFADGNSMIKIYNLSGFLIYNGLVSELTLKRLTQGIYFVHTEDGQVRKIAIR